MRCFVVAGFLLTSASRGPSAIAELLVVACCDHNPVSNNVTDGCKLIATINPCTKFEVSMFIQDMKSYAKCRRCGGYDGLGSPMVIGDMTIR